MYERERKIFPMCASAVLLAFLTAGMMCESANDSREEKETYTTVVQEHNVSAVIKFDIPTSVSGTSEQIPHTIQTVQAEVTEAAEPEDDYKLDVPLDDELQEYIYTLCEEREIPYELAVAIIEQESSYIPDVISKTDDYGLMQINSINHQTVGQTLGIDNFLDPEQNCNAGTYMIAEYYHKYDNVHMALMAYNLGETGAKRRWNNASGIGK